MGENIKERMRSLNLTIAADSFPVLENLKYFRDYNNYINDSLNHDKSLLDTKGQYTGNEPRQLTYELLTYLTEEKKYNAFANIMRVSLLTSLCAFIEMVITTACHNYNTDSSYTNFKLHKYPKKRKPSAIQIAREFLSSKSISGLNDIPNWTYIFDMIKIRNSFVHENGRSNKILLRIAGLYDFTIIEGKVVLGEDFIIKFIEVLEVFSVSFARLLYPDVGFGKKLINELGIDTQQISVALNNMSKGLIKNADTEM